MPRKGMPKDPIRAIDPEQSIIFIKNNKPTYWWETFSVPTEKARVFHTWLREQNYPATAKKSCRGRTVFSVFKKKTDNRVCEFLEGCCTHDPE